MGSDSTFPYGHELLCICNAKFTIKMAYKNYFHHLLGIQQIYTKNNSYGSRMSAVNIRPYQRT